MGEPDDLCACGCGRKPKPGRTYLRAHAGHEARRKKGVWGSHLWTVEDRGHGTPCWIWSGAKHKTNGYGHTMWNGKVTHAHIRAWIESGRARISGLQFDHLCRQRACVNPDHLEQVTQAENMRRGAATKLTWALVREIRERYAAGGISQPALAREYGVTQGNISSILLGHTWKEGT